MTLTDTSLTPARRPARRPRRVPRPTRAHALNNAAGWVLDAIRVKMDEFIAEPTNCLTTVGNARAYLLSQARVLELIDRELRTPTTGGRP